MSDETMTEDQRICEQDIGHDWQKYPYEYETNFGGFMQCKLCGWIQSDDGYDYGLD